MVREAELGAGRAGVGVGVGLFNFFLPFSSSYSKTSASEIKSAPATLLVDKDGDRRSFSLLSQ